METLKKGRRPYRATITRISNELQQDLTKDDPDTRVIRVKMELLKEAMAQMEEWDRKILDQLVNDDCTDEEQDAEFAAIREYKEKFGLVKYDVDKLSDTSRPNSPTSSISSGSTTREGNHKKTFKLPKIELKRFNGDLTEWLGWWSQFEKIHEDEDLHPSDKFQYLVQSTVPGTRARRIAESYPQSAANYPKVIETMKDRFGDPTLLTEVYVRKLLKLVVVNVGRSKESTSLSEMYDELESHLRALESLGVTSDQSSAFLYPMVESSLPEEVLKVWQRSAMSGYDNEDTDKAADERLKSLMRLLRQEVKGAERLSYVRAGLDDPNREKKKVVKEIKQNKQDIPTAAGLFVGQGPSCVFCEKSHESPSCVKAQSMSLEERKEKLQQKRACFACLKPGHMTRNCKLAVKCICCARKHSIMICNRVVTSREIPENQRGDTNIEGLQSTHSTLNCTSEVLLQTLIVDIHNKERRKRKRVRLLCDPGSQRSHILKRTANELELEPTSEVKLCHLLFGGSRETHTHAKYKIELAGVEGGFSCEIQVLDNQKICGSIPRIAKGPWMKQLQQNNIHLSDVGDGSPEIEILLGADYYPKLLTGRILQLENGLTAIETHFGWSLTGMKHQVVEDSVAMTVASMHVIDATIADLWSLETIGIKEPAESKSKMEKEEAIRQHFQRTVSRSEDGRYSVTLPWNDGMQKIPDNRGVAEKRLVSTTKKLQASGKYEQYEDIFNEWLAEGIIEEVSRNDVNVDTAHYLPHRAVFKPESLTTPIRPVFDASCKSYRNPSLNDCLEKGPNLMELIPSVLLRFREKRIGITSDIRKAFQMIEVQEEDRDFLRFLWWEDLAQGTMKIYRHRRVVFGVNCSPFLLAAVIDLHLRGYEKRTTTGEEIPSVAMTLLKSLYVDNCVTSVDTFEEYRHFKEEATEIMAEAKMELRQWMCSELEVDKANLHPHPSEECKMDTNSSDPGSIREKQCTSVLGLKWNRYEDTLSCDFGQMELPERSTKRTILSHVQRIFDPIGYTCPVLLQPKLILQSTWELKMGWDDELPVDQAFKFRKWCEELDSLQRIEIPRNAVGRANSRTSWQIHTFCDASQDAYAAVVFLRTDCENDISVQLLIAKSRVAPLKRSTIPRLELLSCTIAARLTLLVKQALSLVDTPVYYWTDSTTALAWIRRNDNWGTFVGNRVKEIGELTDVADWRHVPGIANPADLPSRGCSPQQLLASRWWEGPEWLKASQDTWPSGDPSADEEVVTREKKASATVNMVATAPEIPWYARQFSSYQRNIRVVAWIVRFLSKLRRQSTSQGRELTIQEMQAAEKTVLRLVQQEEFPQEGNSVAGIRVLRDEEGLIHVKTKLLYRDDTNEFRLPILLPNSHALVTQLITDTHKEHGHAGVQFLMGKLRERFWIVQGRRAIRKVLHSCVNCLRFTATRAPILEFSETVSVVQRHRSRGTFRSSAKKRDS